MEAIKVNVKDFNLDSFISYYEDNIGELVGDLECRASIDLVDKDYMDVLHFEEDYEEFEEGNDYKEVLLNEEYSLNFIIGKTCEGNEKIEFIDGKKYNLMHYLDDLYEDENTIKDIGELKIDLNNLIGLLVDFENGELDISVVNYECKTELSAPRIEVIEDSGDLEEVIKEFIDRFMI